MGSGRNGVSLDGGYAGTGDTRGQPGHSTSELVRKGLRVVASRYYKGRRPPSTRLFESTDTKLGDESELFREIEN
jgi:hypothetical protein